MLKYSLFLNDIMNIILGIMEKTHCLAFQNIVIQLTSTLGNIVRTTLWYKVII